MNPIKPILIFMLLTSYVSAQDKLVPIKAPASPAAVVLGMQPSAILAPKTYDALETALYSNFIGENGFNVPNNFALEFSPYWVRDHGLTVYDYLYAPSLGEQLKRNTTFSIASTQNFVLNDSVNSTAIGFGLGTSLYFPNQADREAIDRRLSALRAGQKTLSAIGAQISAFAFTDATFADFWEHAKPSISAFMAQQFPNLTKAEMNRFLQSVKEEGKALDYDPGSNDAFLAAFFNSIDAKLNGEQLFAEFKDYITDRYGLTVALAYGNFISFPSGNFEYSILPKQAAWTTASYKFKDRLRFLRILALVRYEWYDTDYYARYFENERFFSNNLDYGLSVMGEFNALSVQLELVGRSSSSEIPSGTDTEGNPLFRKLSDSDLQYVATFSYRLTDQISLSYNLGNRFETVGTSGGSLVSLLGLNLGFGAPGKKDLGLIQFEGD